MKQYRQGDVLLVEVSDKDFDTSEFIPADHKTLALGEATGHHHTFECGDVVVYERPEESNLAINNRGQLVDVRSDAVLAHQEHDAITILKGKYVRIIQREYTPEAIVNVRD